MKLLPMIKELRVQHNYSEEYVANLLGMSLATYRIIESVNSGIINMVQLEQLAKLYDTRITIILDKTF